MPGALVYTDDELNIVFCNDRFREMYPVPHELLEPGRPYPAFLRFLAENGYYGEGDIDALVSGRIDSLRNPSGKSFEDRTPAGRVYRILRRRVEAGGVVTVMTDVTEQKEAEDQIARKETQLHVALDKSTRSFCVIAGSCKARMMEVGPPGYLNDAARPMKSS